MRRVVLKLLPAVDPAGARSIHSRPVGSDDREKPEGPSGLPGATPELIYEFEFLVAHKAIMSLSRSHSTPSARSASCSRPTPQST